jgi:hypothetical protein
MDIISSFLTTTNNNKFMNGILVILVNIGTNYLMQDIVPVVNKIFRLFWIKRLVLLIIFYLATRDWVVSIILAVVFSVIVDVFLNEKSRYCVVPERFKDYAGAGLAPPSNAAAADTLSSSLFPLPQGGPHGGPPGGFQGGSSGGP